MLLASHLSSHISSLINPCLRPTLAGSSSFKNTFHIQSNLCISPTSLFLTTPPPLPSHPRPPPLAPFPRVGLDWIPGSFSGCEGPWIRAAQQLRVSSVPKWTLDPVGNFCRHLLASNTVQTHVSYSDEVVETNRP